VRLGREKGFLDPQFTARTANPIFSQPNGLAFDSCMLDLRGAPWFLLQVSLCYTTLEEAACIVRTRKWAELGEQAEPKNSLSSRLRRFVKA
jgi:hypothetical protein